MPDEIMTAIDVRNLVKVRDHINTGLGTQRAANYRFRYA